jgi:hypothetical protein
MPGTQEDKTHLDPAITRLIQDEIDRRVDRIVKNLKLFSWLAGFLLVTPIGAMLASPWVRETAFKLVGLQVEERVESFLNSDKAYTPIDARVENYLKANKGDPHFKTFLNKAVAYSYSGYARLDPDNPFLFLRFYKSEEDSGELKCKANFRDLQNATQVKQIEIWLNDKPEAFKILKVDKNFSELVINKDFDLSLKPQDMFYGKPEPWHELKIKLVVDEDSWKPSSQPRHGGLANVVTHAGEPARQSVYVDMSCVVAVYGAALYDRLAQTH